jgi:hypothetical protein
VSDPREWIRKAAAANERVGVVDSLGLLVNVGRLSESDDARRVVFSSESSSGTAYVWLTESDDADETLSRIVPMTPELDARWRLVWSCRELAWNCIPNDVLEAVLKVVWESGNLKLPGNDYANSG